MEIMVASVRAFLIFLVVLIVVSCQDDPGSLGDDLIPDRDRIEIKEINSTDENFDQKSYSYSGDSLGLGASQTVLLGKHSNVESILLTRYIYTLPDSIEDKILADSINILDSWVEMRKVYEIGDASGIFGFTANEITSQWTSVGFEADSLDFLQTNPQNVASDIQTTDSTITFKLDNTLLMEWIVANANGTNSSVYGLIYKPTPETNKVFGFPALSSSISITSLPTIYTIVEAPGVFVDTVTAIPTADIHVIRSSYPSVSNNNLVLQAGIPVRTNLWFDVSSMPADVIINEAELVLQYDSLSSSVGTISSDSLTVSMLSDSAAHKLNENYSSIILRRSGNEYSGKITGYVQKWLEDPKENQGMQIKVTVEMRTTNKVELYSSKNDNPALRPRLSIIYTGRK